ncbi:MAG: hypothetical protein U0840_29195 [Gemmataceae bacterium]
MSLAAPLVLGAGSRADRPQRRSRDLEAKDLANHVKRGIGLKTYKITEATDLRDVFNHKAGREALAGQVDFKKEYLLVVVWSGSGGDKLTFEVQKGDKGSEAVLKMQRGLTRDLRQHLKVFAFPKNLPYRMAGAKK